MNNLNNTTIENKGILTYENYREMNYVDLIHRIEMIGLEARIAKIEHDTSMLGFQLEMDRLNRTLDKFSN